MSSSTPHVDRKHKVTPQREGPSRDRPKPAAEMAEQPDLLALQRAVLNPAQAAPGDILRLQHTAGNRAVSRLIQTKLTVGGAGDRYEQEADRVAEQVVSGQSARRQPGIQRHGEEEEVQTKPLAATITPVVQRQEDEEEVQTKPLLQRQEDEEEIQTKPLLQRQEDEEEVQTKSLVQRRADGGFDASPELEGRLSALKGRGSPLPDGMRTYMEPRFGTDFSGVRLHTGGDAVQMNKQLKSQAFTHGRDIYLGAGAQTPGSEAGNRLLAHELAHTIQQGAGGRIQGFWPLGHRLVTGLAMAEGDFNETYDDSARRFLIDRAPDMDNIQDEVDTMRAGMAVGGERLKQYEKLIKEKKWAVAKRMYDNNELHIRKPAYMLNHGEAGLYKDADASAKNEAVTSRLIDKAVATWQAGQQPRGLEILSDALHQAEDRGSHGEGNAFSGHDVRLNLTGRPWETHYREGWAPDNADINPKGAVLGVGFAQGVLTKFKNAVGAGPDNKVSMHGPEPARRALHFGPVEQTSHAKLAGIFATLKGGSGPQDLPALWNLFQQHKGQEVSMDQYRSAKQTPEVRTGAEYGSQLTGGIEFYEEAKAKIGQPKGPEKTPEEITGLPAEAPTPGLFPDREYQAAVVKFEEFKKSRVRGGKSKQERKTAAKAYLAQRVTIYTRISPRMVGPISDTIKLAYHAVFGEPMPD
jgi:hypothetical protein